MILYSFTFRPLSKLLAIPDSQSFFGTLCHYYKAVHGEEALVDMLTRSTAGKPDFIVSSFFPHRLLPVPLAVRGEHLEKATLEQIAIIKNLKKVKYFSKSVMIDYLHDEDKFNNQLNLRIVSGDYRIIHNQYLVKKEELDAFKNLIMDDDIEIRNMIMDKRLFYQSTIYCHHDFCFDAYISFTSKASYQKLKLVIEKLEYVSIGGGKSIGLNLFSYIGENEENIKNQNETKLLLSKAIGDKEIDYNKSYYQLLRLNNKFNYGKETIYKKNSIVFTEGSCLKTNKDYCGLLIPENINNETRYTNYLGLLI